MLERFERVAGHVAGSALMLMLVLGAADVAGSWIFGLPVPGTLEITESLMVLSVYLTLAYTQGKDAHVRVSLLVSRLPPRTRACSRCLAQSLSTLFFAILSAQALRHALASVQVGEYRAGLIPLPVYPAKICLAVGLLLMTWRCAAGTVRDFRRVGSTG